MIKEILNKLDCSKLAPCSESLMSISIEDHLTPNKCQISVMNNLKDELFIATNGGCLIIVQSSTLRPITVFRPHEQEITILHAYEFCDNTIDTTTTSTSSSSTTSSSKLNSKQNNNSNTHKNEKFLVTIGKGYRSLADRYVKVTTTQQLSTSTSTSTTQNDKRNQMFYATLWKTGYWM